MGSFTVLSASVKKELPPKDGQRPKKVVVLVLKDHMDQTKTAEWFTNADSPLPGEGSSVDGEIEPSQYGLKFKKAFAGGGGGFYKPRDPKETAAIQRQHSQSAAVAYLQAKATAGGLGSATFPDVEAFRSLIDWFQRDIEHGVALAQQQSAYGTPERKDTLERTGVSDVPSEPAEAFSHPDPGSTSDVPFGDAA